MILMMITAFCFLDNDDDDDIADIFKDDVDLLFLDYQPSPREVVAAPRSFAWIDFHFHFILFNLISFSLI